MLQKIFFASFIATLLFVNFFQIDSDISPVANVTGETLITPPVRPTSRPDGHIEQSSIDKSTSDSRLAALEGLFIQKSKWSEEEMAAVQQIVDYTLNALKEVGLDGRQILAGYRFRRYDGNYVNDVEGVISVIDHEMMEIILADNAFLRHQGFNIYHELGHAVDYRLARQLSQSYHQIAGSGQEIDDEAWNTADGYWLRFHGRDDREEATADAFALWIFTSQADLDYPVFYGTPTTVDYEGMVDAISSSFADLVFREPKQETPFVLNQSHPAPQAAVAVSDQLLPTGTG